MRSAVRRRAVTATDQSKLSFKTPHIRDKCLALRCVQHEDIEEPRTAAAIQAFDGLFYLVRDPKYKSRKGKGQHMLISRPFLRLQLAILWHKYIDGGPVAGYWRQILQSIAA